MKKKIIFSALVFFAILIVFLIIFEYKNSNLGNNISVSDENYILNISSYEATVEIEVNSNKNKNKYLVKQEYLEPNFFKQEVLEPSNIKGLAIISDGESVTLQNQLLNLKTIYTNFNGDLSNLSLISFINSYKTGIENFIEENENEIIMKAKIKESKNKYQMYQNLYINKDTKLPTKMEILDINKNVTVYILYKEITINKLSKGEII